ncbi:MAG TPA: hypothetical protein VGD52_03760 [Pseudoduganella sp.]
MNQVIQDLAAEELALVNGSGFEIDPPVANSEGVDYPAVVNNPPG